MDVAPDTEPRFGAEIFTDPEMLKPLSHPMRFRVYTEAVREAVSAKELADQFEQPLPRISYHVRELADAGLLRPVRRTPRRGAVETHYRAIATLEINDELLLEAAPEVRRLFHETGVRLIAEDVLHAVEEGAFDEPDLFFTRAHFTVTPEGRRRVAEVVRDMYDRLAALEEELRVEPGGEAEELNVVLIDYNGTRKAGRNGPFIVTQGGVADTPETIPPD